MQHLDYNHLSKLGEQLRGEYLSNHPFPHIVIDNFVNSALLEAIVERFPSPDSPFYQRFDNPLEKKLASNRVDLLDPMIQRLLDEFNQPSFLGFLEKITGIDALYPDPRYTGGGVHQIPQGGKLDVHIDFNYHKELDMDRRLNVILYLNKDWESSWGGDLQLWKGKKDGDHHVLEYLAKRVYPIFNRLVIFSTSEISYHGHPDPLMCPEGVTRKSFAFYYYTKGRPVEEVSNVHSTTFVKRPWEDESLDPLRAMISSSI